MESNLMNCPTCGHTVSNGIGACAYCGAIMSGGEQNQQTDDKIVAEEEWAAESAATSQQEEVPPAAEIFDEVSETTAADKGQSDSEPIADEIQVSAELEILDMAVDEPAAPETPQEGITGMVEVEAAQQNHATQTAVTTETFSEIIVEDVKTDDEENLPSTNDSGLAVYAKPELNSEVSEDTILLDISDAIEIPPAELEVETVKMESPASSGEAEIKPVDLAAETQQVSAEILKIEKDAQDMAAAIEKQKASALEAKKAKETTAAKEQALKMQKAALAKARAQKKQKMIQAKAAALKRKKAAQAKVQALKRQRADQVAVEPAMMEEPAAAQITSEDSQPKVNRAAEAKNKLQGLLEKYRGQAIGINYDSAAEIREAQLVEANGDFFSVFVEGQKLHYSYPLNTILTVIEGQDGVDTGDSKQQDKFNVVIKVYPLAHI